MDTSASAGNDNGAISRTITRSVPAPSRRNASSYSRGMPAKKPRRKKIIKGRLELTYSKTRPYERVEQVEPVHEQVLGDQQQHVGYGQAGQEESKR